MISVIIVNWNRRELLRASLESLRRQTGAEFETILLFDSLENVKAFAGDDLDLAVYFEQDNKYLVERDFEVRHYEVDVRMV